MKLAPTAPTAQRLATAIHQAGESVMMMDPAGTIEYVNPAFEATSGYSYAEVVGQQHGLFRSGECDDLSYENCWETVSTGRIWRGYVTLRSKDGSLREVEMTVSPVFDDDGSVTNLIGVMREVSRRRDQENRLHLFRKLEAVSRLAGGLAHDLNNLLTSILGHADLGARGLEPGHTAHGDLVEIRRAGEQAADLTDQLLAFSRQQMLQPQVVDLNEVVIGLETPLHRAIGENVRLVTRLDPTLGRIKADRSQLERVILNLAINARDAMREGGDLVLETRNLVLSEDYAAHDVAVTLGAYVTLTVSDSGVGMNEEVRSRVFEPFFTTKAPNKGAGLGLSTVYGIVKQSGGYVWAYSEPGRGSIFKVLLPQVDAGGGDLPLASEAPRRHVEPSTIVVVDDNPIVRSLVCRLLEQEGHRVLSSENAEDVLDLSHGQLDDLDLLLTDYTLPKMSGLALSREIQSRIPGLPVILMSGYSKAAKLKAEPDLAGVHFLQKPFVRSGLLEAVEIALGSRREDGHLQEDSAKRGEQT